MPNIDILEKTANILRKHIVEMIGPVHRGHYGGSLSCAEIITALYFYKMKHDPKNPSMYDRDRFIMSKGHSGLIQYAALGECGYFPKEEFKTLKELGSRLQGHPDMKRLPGIEANTGSLGQGLSLGNGIAKALKMDGISAAIYVLLGDGELNEGQVWEAVMFAAHYKLDNVVAIVDKNNIQAMGRTLDRMSTESIYDKFRSFGWSAFTVNGHNIKDLILALDQCDERLGKPKVIIAETIKGKGLKIGENTAAFHNNGLTEEQYEEAIADLTAVIGGEYH